MLNRPVYILGGALFFFCIAAAFIIGCDQEDRHKLLDFFIDGVPPFGGYDPNDPNSPNYETASSSTNDPVNPNAPRWYIHKPSRECHLCHGDERQQTFGGAINLVDSEPQLCYNCHTDFVELGGNVHGPVAVGECLICHSHHKSRNRSLLKKPVPEICFTCHNKKLIEAIPDHNPEMMDKCTFCHHAHSGPYKKLLKMNFELGTNLDYNFGRTTDDQEGLEEQSPMPRGSSPKENNKTQDSVNDAE